MPCYDCRSIKATPMTEAMLAKLAAHKKVHAILKPLETPNPPPKPRVDVYARNVYAQGGYSTGERL